MELWEKKENCKGKQGYKKDQDESTAHMKLELLDRSSSTSRVRVNTGVETQSHQDWQERLDLLSTSPGYGPKLPMGKYYGL